MFLLVWLFNSLFVSISTYIHVQPKLNLSPLLTLMSLQTYCMNFFLQHNLKNK